MTKKGFLGVSELLFLNLGSILDFSLILDIYLAPEHMASHSVLEANGAPRASPGTEISPSYASKGYCGAFTLWKRP